MNVLGMLAAVPSPPAWARGTILRRAVSEQPTAVRQGSAPGKVISVDHGEDHQFIDVTEDLQMIVIFAPPDLPDEE